MRVAAPEAGRHAETVHGLLEAVLRAARVGLRDLDGVAVSIGPGSFTGLRVGLAAAKVLAVFGSLPLAGVPTLAAMALEAENLDFREILATRDAGRGQVYAARFRSGPTGPRPAGGPWILEAAVAASRVPADARRMTEVPSAAAVAALGAMRILAGRRDDPDRLVPLYLRRPQAEELRRARGR